MIKSDFILLALAILIGLYIVFVPTPGLDCRRYHEKTFHGVAVNCERIPSNGSPAHD